jgi:putative membrane protein
MHLRPSAAALAVGVTASFTVLPALPASAATPVTAQDAAFLKMSAAADLAEISLGRVALKQGQTAETKRFAAKVIHDHTAALKDARTVAKALGITLPSAPLPPMRAVAKAVSAHSGLAFDLAYLKAERTGHLQNIAAGAKEIKLGTNGRIRGQAVDGSPMLRFHLWLDNQYLSWVVKAAGR